MNDQDNKPKIVAWTEKDGDEWIVYDAESNTGEHIAKHQKEHHYKTIFPIFDRPAEPDDFDIFQVFAEAATNSARVTESLQRLFDQRRNALINESIVGEIRKAAGLEGQPGDIVKAVAALRAMPATSAQPAAWLDLAKMKPKHMAYATEFKTTENQTPLYTAPFATQAEPNGKLVGWWNGIMPDLTGRSPEEPSVRWGAGGQNAWHDIPLYDGYNPIHYTAPNQQTPQTWTRVRPTEPGWYWIRKEPGEERIEHIHVSHGDNYCDGQLSIRVAKTSYGISHRRISVAQCELEYFGPLKPPA